MSDNQTSDLLLPPDSNKNNISELTGEIENERINMIYKGKTPSESASLWSKALFSWAYPLIRHARTHQLEIDQMGIVSPNDKVEVQLQRLNDSWARYKVKPNQKNSLFWAVLDAFRHEYKVAMIWNIIVALLQVSSPFILHRLIEFIKQQKKDTTGGIFLVVTLVITQGLSYFISEHLKLYQRMIGVKSTNAMIAMIYEKQFRITTSTNKKFSSGELVNFVQVDAMKLALLSQTLPYVMKLPVLLVICFIVLFVYLGRSFWAGMGIFLITFLSNMVLGRIQARLQKVFMKKQDARVNTTSESLNNIKMLKLYSWTAIFNRVIESKRVEELGVLWQRFKYGQVIVTSLYFFPQILSAVIFSVYIGCGNTLSISTAFTVMTILNLLQDPLRTLPLFVGQLIEFLVSMRRIQDFISLNELNESTVVKVDRESTQESIEIWSGNFHWGAKMRSDEAEPTKIVSEVIDAENERIIQEPPLKDFLALKNVDLKIRQGEFVCVIGDVGSGKSSLLSSIIGDLLYCNPMFMTAHSETQLNEDLKGYILEHSQIQIPQSEAPIRISEDLSYVQQQPWMQNKSIKDNILFGLPFNEAKYKETIKICELKRDLQILPAGDQTEIGEKGINLSGGQKARIGLARAVYADRQIYLMDDPLSALDANVKKKIFKNVFIEKFNQKTRVLVTHAIDFLHLVDSIILLKAGKVVFKGPYEQVKKNQYLQELIQIHKSHQQQKQTNETQLIDISIDVQQQPLDLNQISESSQSESDSDNENEKPIRKLKKPKQRSYSIDLGEVSENAKKLSGNITTNENDEEARVEFSVYRDFNNYCGGWRQLLYTNLAMTGFITTKVAVDWLVGDWATSPDQHSKYAYYCTGQFTLAALCSVFVFLRVLILQYYSWYGTKSLHEDMMAKVLNAPINLYFDTTPIGRIMNRFSKDLQLIEVMFNYQIGGLYVSAYLTLSIIILSIVVVPWIALLYPFIIFIIAVLFRLTVAANKEVNRVESLTKSPLLSYLTESISGNSTIRAFQRKEDFILQNFKYLNNNIMANMWSESVPLWFAIRVDILSLITMTVISVICVLARFRVDPIMLSLLLTYVLSLQMVLSSMVRMMMDTQARMVNVQRLLSLLKIPQEKVGGLNKTDLGNWPTRGEIEFKEVVLRYRPTTDIVLDKLTFLAKPGEKIGVVGRTGAGKSTICLSLSRIVEIVEGSILIDGVDISKVELAYLRSKITVIPQDPTMFTGTLRFNLDPDNQNSDERILEILNKAQLDDLLHRDERGLNMQITESGQNLSSGERQLICICRAILRASCVVILDEATANIDVVTEQKIQTLIGAEFKNATMITIAHRLNTIIGSDKVMVLSFGKILEYDSPQMLMSDEKSEFSSLLKEIEKEEKNQK